MLDRFNAWLDQVFVTHWREATKMASVRLAALFSAVTGVVIADPTPFIAIIGLLPETGIARLGSILVVVFCVFAVPVITRLWNEGRDDV